MTTSPNEVVFVLTDNNLREGGRPRDPLEVYLNVDGEKAAYLRDDPILCATDDGEELRMRCSGTKFKNFRSSPVVDLGKWLILRCRALPGDEVHARWEDGEAGGVLRLAYIRKYAAPALDAKSVQARSIERELELALVDRLKAQGCPTIHRQARVLGGDGRLVGVIDVLTPDTIYEVKSALTRDSMYEAVGQLMVYQAARGAGAPLRLVLVGRQTRETAPLVPVLARIGVEVDAWRE